MDIFQAVTANNLNAVRQILDDAPNIVNTIDADGNTPLAFAVIKARVSNNETYTPMVKLLLEHGSNPNVLGNEFNVKQPLLLKVLWISELVKLLLQFGADPNVESTGGKTSLDLLISRLVRTDGGQQMFKLTDSFQLIVNDPHTDLDKRDDNGETYLMRVGILYPLYTSMLLDAGADPFMTGRNGQTTIDRIKPAGFTMEGLYGNTPIYTQKMTQYNLLQQAMASWALRNEQAQQNLTKKFIVARRLRQGTQTAAGYTLEIPQREISEGIIRKAEYDHVCQGLQSNLNKPGVIALAKSLRIPTSNKTKIELCQAVASQLIK